MTEELEVVMHSFMSLKFRQMRHAAEESTRQQVVAGCMCSSHEEPEDKHEYLH